MAFSLIQAFRTKPRVYLIIKHPSSESRVLRFLARALLLALFIVSFPYFGSILKGSSIASDHGGFDSDNYKIVYLKQSESSLEVSNKSPAQRRLFSSDAKRAALDKLEDVLLEPPRSASGKSRRYLQKTRYLPDLMGDSLESYPRHVFIDVGFPEKEGGSGTGWFAKNYPTRNKKFEMYKIETVSSDQESSSPAKLPPIGISNWLTKNVRSEEYVVMKAEAEVVEEMIRSKAIGLIDELFLECKPQTNGGRKFNGSRRRAYWQCLALYGQLRDEGVAVHQWWG